MTSTQKIICFIFARGGSKGLPGKNIKPLAGMPLIAHAIACAKSIDAIDDVIVSTDDSEIAEVAEAYGAKVPFMRPAELASDDAPEWLSWQHAVRWYQDHHGSFDVFLSLPTTAPLRAAGDVEACFGELLTASDADGVITVRTAERSPYFNMVQKDKDGFVRLFAKADGHVSRRQDAPPIFDIVTVAYAARPDFILSAAGLFAGNLRSVEVPAERAIDIDTPYDFSLAEFLMEKRLAGQQIGDEI